MEIRVVCAIFPIALSSCSSASSPDRPVPGLILYPGHACAPPPHGIFSKCFNVAPVTASSSALLTYLCTGRENVPSTDKGSAPRLETS